MACANGSLGPANANLPAIGVAVTAISIEAASRSIPPG
jgi:hypothetical protein